MLKHLFIGLLVVLASCQSAVSPADLQTVREACVKLTISTSDGLFTGSAFCIKTDCQNNGHGGYEYKSYFLTAKHVAEYGLLPGAEVSLECWNGNVYKALVLSLNPGADAALVGTITEQPIRSLPLVDKDPELYSQIVSIGFPCGIGPVITEGIINCKVTNDNVGLWLCSAPTGPGGSGGLVVEKLTGIPVGITIEISRGQFPDGSVFILPHTNQFVSIHGIFDWIVKETTHVR